MQKSVCLTTRRRPWRHRSLAALAGVMLAALAGFGVAGTRTPAIAVADSTSDALLFGLINQDRTSNGVAALQYYQPLAGIAESGSYGGCGFTVHGRAQDMIDRNYFAHPILGCGGQYVFSMMNAFGVRYSFAGENIGWNNNGGQAESVAAINTSFMNSPEHRANILNPRFTHVGIGSANSGAAQWNGGSGQGYQNVAMYAEEFAQLPAGAPGSSPPAPPPPPLQALDTTTLSDGAAAVVGTDRQPYGFVTGTFTALGGRTDAAPAVVMTSAITLYIVIGDDHALWVRSGAPGSTWQPLSSSPNWCQGSPAATMTNGALMVGCVGGDGALWTAQASPAGSGLPLVTSFHSLGGFLTSGPGLATVSGTPTFVAAGTGGRIWFRSDAGPWQATGWQCVGHPALGNIGTTAYFGCQGSDHGLWTSVDSGPGWSPPSTSGGQLVGGVGVAPVAPGAGGGARYFVEGTTGDLWEATLGNDGVTTSIRRGGQVVDGAGAAGF